MRATLIDGKSIAAALRESLKEKISILKSKGITPGLATVLVGENPASQIYVRNKRIASEAAGIRSLHYDISASISTEELLQKINELNNNPEVHGILVQLPLPPQVDADRILCAIDPAKDADGFHPFNMGRMFAAKSWQEYFAESAQIPLPCTPYGVMEMLERMHVDPSGKNAVILGRSTIVGKPMAMLLLSKNATVTVAHSKTAHLKEICAQADILVAAIGKARFLTQEMIKPGACVIDVGINRLPDGKLAGDVDFAAACERAGMITPVPGGVGPMTIAMLLANTVNLALNTLHS